MHTENDGILHSQTFDPDTKNQEMLGEGALCFRRQNTLLGGVIYMTVWDSSNEDKKKRQGKRNKSTDAYVNKCDRRKGFWSNIDRAVLKEGRLLDSWLLPLRV